MDFASYKRIVHCSAQQVAAQVVETHAPGSAPNFYVARIVLPDGATVFVLCSNEGNWAFSNEFVENECRLQFVDCPSFANVLGALYGITPLLKAELEGKFRKQPFNSAEEIRYWKPKTVGEGIFNWWD